MNNIVRSLKRINYRMFFALFLLGLIPTVYTTLRIFFLGQFPSDYSFSIAGQLSWVSLLYEIVEESIILPLFFFIGKVVNDKKELSNRIRTGLLVTGGIYLLLSVVVITFVKPLLNVMGANQSIVDSSVTYIRIEAVAYVFSTLVDFLLVVFVTIGKNKYLYSFMGAKLVLCVLFDTFLVSDLPFSAKLGVNGIGVSNIIVNFLLLVGCIFVLLKVEKLLQFPGSRMSFAWMKDFARIGGISGLESLVRNLAYMLMICRMVNVVNESGTYWVANNFIWGWLLLPITQLGEMIKRDCGSDENTIKNKTLAYFSITLMICLLWFISIPVWKPFMQYVLQFQDVDKLFNLVMVLLGFYVLYAIQNVFDMTFYGLGKTHYMLFESIVTNTLYYGGAFVLYITGVWQPTLTGIALLFGIGMAFDSIVSFGAYVFLLKKKHINIFKIPE